jgi:predicted nucleic acid-binding protein
MMLCVETNFLLELAYLQEEHLACEQLLAMAELGSTRLTIPAFCLVEAREGLRQRKRQRREFFEKLQGQLRELGRLAPHKAIPAQSEPLRNALLYSSDQEMQRLESTVARLSRLVTPAPVTSASASDASRYEADYDLAPFDALVLAVIRAELLASAVEPKCFVTKNGQDFDVPGLHAELATFNCKLLLCFQDALGWTSYTLRQGDTTNHTSG